LALQSRTLSLTDCKYLEYFESVAVVSRNAETSIRPYADTLSP
jgi:hypothetical protein